LINGYSSNLYNTRSITFTKRCLFQSSKVGCISEGMILLNNEPIPEVLSLSVSCQSDIFIKLLSMILFRNSIKQCAQRCKNSQQLPCWSFNRHIRRLCSPRKRGKNNKFPVNLHRVYTSLPNDLILYGFLRCYVNDYL